MELLALLFILWWVWVGFKVIGWIVSDRFINGRNKVGHAPPKPLRIPTYVEWTKSQYIKGNMNIIDFMEALDDLFERGIADHPAAEHFFPKGLPAPGPPGPRASVTRRSLSDGSGDHVEVIGFGPPTFGKSRGIDTKGEWR
jgi:hypothetical protein